MTASVTYGRAARATPKAPRAASYTTTWDTATQIEGRSVLPWELDRVLKAIAELWSEDALAVEGRVAENLRQLGYGRAES